VQRYAALSRAWASVTPMAGIALSEPSVIPVERASAAVVINFTIDKQQFLS